MTNRNQFVTELENLKLELIQMGDLVIANLNDGFSSFFTLDLKLAEQTIKNDKIVNATEQKIEKTCLRIIMKEQPVASDLRLITAVLKMITDLERIGDHAADISKMLIFMEKTKQIYPISSFEPMAETCNMMIKNALQSFVNEDLVKANFVIQTDDIVDDLFEKIKRTVSEAIRKGEIDADYAIYAMMVAKYLERIADHAVNISEWVIYSVTGEHVNTPDL
ncbi:MAG: phosphate signaling complex protein PhoU [Candidatus Izemoplasmatales bacterium]